jgi:hypothetical protein
VKFGRYLSTTVLHCYGSPLLVRRLQNTVVLGSYFQVWRWWQLVHSRSHLGFISASSRCLTLAFVAALEQLPTSPHTPPSLRKRPPLHLVASSRWFQSKMTSWPLTTGRLHWAHSPGARL